MSTKQYHRITSTGQIILCTHREQVVTNPNEILTRFIATDALKQETPPTNPIRALYHLGDGVSAFKQTIKGVHTYYWNSIQIETLPFLTLWELCQNPNINNGNHYICPWNGNEKVDPTSIRAPLNLPIPSDLIVYFHVEFIRSLTDPDLQLPEAHDLKNITSSLLRTPSTFYLSCFSRSRNTCVNLPLPNLYEDGHLCVGDSFNTQEFRQEKNHEGIVTSTRNYLKAWTGTRWNLDLLGHQNSLTMKKFRQFIRFDATTGDPLPFTGCQEWDIATSSIPLETIYKPWIKDTPTATPSTETPPNPF